jgi:hypothetical protein
MKGIFTSPVAILFENSRVFAIGANEQGLLQFGHLKFVSL